MDIYGHAKEGVSGIKHFYWVKPICLPHKGTNENVPIEKRQLIGIASNEMLNFPSFRLAPNQKKMYFMLEKGNQM